MTAGLSGRDIANSDVYRAREAERREKRGDWVALPRSVPINPGPDCSHAGHLPPDICPRLGFRFRVRYGAHMSAMVISGEDK